jgi:hypothetical protein
MNCAAVRKHLLAADAPSSATGAAARHLAGCDACRDWQRRWLQAEQGLPLLPVPDSSAARAALLRRLLEVPVAEPVPRLIRLTAPPQPTPKERGLRKLALALAMAAALALFAVGWRLWPHQIERPGRADPIVARQVQRDLRLAAARSPRERVEVLSDLADELRREAQALARQADADSLRVLARFYAEVVRDNLPAQARALPAEERAVVVAAVLVRLTEAESELQRLRAERGGDALDAPLSDIALAARDGSARLRELLRV